MVVVGALIGLVVEVLLGEVVVDVLDVVLVEVVEVVEIVDDVEVVDGEELDVVDVEDVDVVEDVVVVGGRVVDVVEEVEVVGPQTHATPSVPSVETDPPAVIHVWPCWQQSRPHGVMFVGQPQPWK